MGNQPDLRRQPTTARYTVPMLSKESSTTTPEAPRRALSLVDTTSIMVGIIIGSAIYEIAPLVANSSVATAASAVSWMSKVNGGPPPSAELMAGAGLAAMTGVWLVGGLLALVGALCYAELATAYPEAGGTYVFLTKGLGRLMGFAFAWSEFWIVRPGNVGAVAFVLARYAAQLIPASLAATPHIELYLALVAILTLAVLNAFGLRAGKSTQNVLTGCKVFGLMAI